MKKKIFLKKSRGGGSQMKEKFHKIKVKFAFLQLHILIIMHVGYLPASILMKTLFSNLDHFWFVESKTKEKRRKGKEEQ